MIGKDNPVVILEELKYIEDKKILGQFGYICYTYDPKKKKIFKVQ